jgi:hypothetical protein
LSIRKIAHSKSVAAKNLPSLLLVRIAYRSPKLEDVSQMSVPALLDDGQEKLLPFFTITTPEIP